MIENREYQMAIDMLCCHLGLSEEEAKAQLERDLLANSDTVPGSTDFLTYPQPD